MLVLPNRKEDNGKQPRKNTPFCYITSQSTKPQLIVGQIDPLRNVNVDSSYYEGIKLDVFSSILLFTRFSKQNGQSLNKLVGQTKDW